MSEENTVYDAMNEFANITQAAALTANEVALFYALLQSWNAARRPAVIEQWATTTCQYSGLTLKTLNQARNKLAQRGVIFWDKTSNRSFAKYSLSALFRKDNPFTGHLLAKMESKRDSKRPVSGQ